MSTIDFTYESLHATLDKTEGIVLIDFWAEWCIPCRTFAPIYEKISEEHPDVVFGKVDTEAQADLAMEFEIQSIPTLVVFRDGVLVYGDAGTLPEPALRDLVTQVKALDMDAIRAKIAEIESQGPQR